MDTAVKAEKPRKKPLQAISGLYAHIELSVIYFWRQVRK